MGVFFPFGVKIMTLLYDAGMHGPRHKKRCNESTTIGAIGNHLLLPRPSTVCLEPCSQCFECAHLLQCSRRAGVGVQGARHRALLRMAMAPEAESPSRVFSLAAGCAHSAALLSSSGAQTWVIMPSSRACAELAVRGAFARIGTRMPTEKVAVPMQRDAGNSRAHSASHPLSAGQGFHHSLSSTERQP